MKNFFDNLKNSHGIIRLGMSETSLNAKWIIVKNNIGTFENDLFEISL